MPIHRTHPPHWPSSPHILISRNSEERGVCTINFSLSSFLKFPTLPHSLPITSPYLIKKQKQPEENLQLLPPSHLPHYQHLNAYSYFTCARIFSSEMYAYIANFHLTPKDFHIYLKLIQGSQVKNHITTGVKNDLSLCHIPIS